tara:strand:- start:276 stop:899 length:624 start_codon:yes stop_codon:yes gene_type:complete
MSNYLVQGGVTPDGSVTAAKIVAGAVSSTKIVGETITGQTNGTVAAGDSFLFSDVNDSGNLKDDTVQGILDLVSAGPAQAAAAALVAETNQDTYAPPDLIKYAHSSVKVWASYTSVSTTALKDSYNCASIADDGTATSTITIASDFTNDDYGGGGITNANATTYGSGATLNPRGSETTVGDIQLVSQAGASLTDSLENMVTLSGELA